MKPPVYVEQLPAKQVNNQPNAGSLFGRGDNPLFADRKAMVVIVAVIPVTTGSTASPSWMFTGKTTMAPKTNKKPAIVWFATNRASCGSNFANKSTAIINIMAIPATIGLGATVVSDMITKSLQLKACLSSHHNS